MISIKLIPVDKKNAGSDNAVTRNTVTRNDNTETYIPKDIDLDTLKIGSAYLCYDKNANALKVYGANDGSMNLYALGDVAALGQSSMQGGGGGTSYNRLDSWASYDANKAGWVLSAGLGKNLDGRVASLENGQIEGVATQEWVQNQGYLTELSAATTNALGAIKIGYSANNKNYPVKLDNNNRAYVSVPWSDTSYGVFGVSANGLMPMASASNKTTAETAVGNYYLCADGKFRQLPANAFNDTWRPLGTGANNACAGNDARLSNARPASDVSAWAKASTKPSYTLDEVTDGSTRKLSNYVTAIGVSGNTLTWSKNGVAQTAITVPFATNATTATKLGTDEGSNIKPVYFSGGKPVECNYQFGNNKGNAAVSNGTLCASLNADLLDGHDGSYYAKVADVSTLQGYFTNGVANKAKVLNTAHTIWGQSFNGSANVSGAMTGVTSMDGLIYFDTTNNYIGIGNTSPNYKLDVTGVIHSTAGMFSDDYVSALGQNTSSDERLKDIKGDIDLSVGLYANAPSKLFEWKDNKALGTQVGTIAQYWEKELPQVVHDRGDGYLSMQYDVTALLGTITIAKKVVEQEDRINELEETIEKLRNEIDMMKKG